MGCGRFVRGCVVGSRCIQMSCVLVVVTVKTKQLPVTAVCWIVVVVVVSVVNRQLVEILPSKLARTSSANPGVKLQCTFAVIPFPLRAIAPRLGYESVQLV